MYEETRKFLTENEGKTVKLVGKISNIMWQHIILSLEDYPYFNYFDLENGFQIIIYSKEEINCPNKIEIIGKIIAVNNESKKSNPENRKILYEYHIVVESWKCIN
ncbi:MAG: hypothetical protein ACP6IY_08290 [Promethearchaeia archaeon]